MGKPIISVIVTVHNAERYIREGLKSVMNQTFSDIEIICIDGGSKDASPQILRELQSKDARIRIIDDPNTSYGHKINRGIEEARGQYISVLESDDMYELDMLEKLFSVMQRYEGLDFVNANYTEVYNVGKYIHTKLVRMYGDSEYNHVIEVNDGYDYHDIMMVSRYWTGLFSKDFLEREQIRLNESPGASFQDMSFRFLTGVLAKRFYHLDDSVYIYRTDNPDSSMNDCKKTVVLADEHDYLKEELRKRNIINPYIWHYAYDWKYSDMYGNLCYLLLNEKYRMELFERYIVELDKDKELIRKYEIIPYRDVTCLMTYRDADSVLDAIHTESEAHIERIQSDKAYNHFVAEGLKENVIVFGSGIRGQRFINEVSRTFSNYDAIKCFVDNSEEKWSTTVAGYKVISLDECLKTYRQATFFVSVLGYEDEIKAQLISAGVNSIDIRVISKIVNYGGLLTGFTE